MSNNVKYFQEEQEACWNMVHWQCQKSGAPFARDGGGNVSQEGEQRRRQRQNIFQAYWLKFDKESSFGGEEYIYCKKEWIKNV